MSIWSSWRDIGWDGLRKKPKMRHGEVRSYAAGWSNHYPTTDGAVEQPASVGIASVPVWCVPGHAEEMTDELGPWLRLDVDGWEGHGPGTKRQHCAVVLDEKAARALARDLRRWLKAPKAHPRAVTHP